MEIDRSAFQGEELRFGRASTVRRKSAGLAAGSGHAMAGNEDRDGVLSHGLADLLGGIGLARRLGDFAISARLSRRNFASGFVDLAKKRSHIAQIHGDAAKVLNFPSQMTSNSSYDGDDRRGRKAGPVGTGLPSDAGFRGSWRGFRKLNRGDHRP